MSDARPSPFRQAALERLSSPEQLDRLITVARPADWLTALALGALVLVALGWSIFGSMATRIAGSGILVGERGAIFTPTAAGEGTVMAILVTAGQEVAAGQRLARIAQPALEADLATARATAGEYRAQLGTLRRQVESYAGARGRNNASQRRLMDEERGNAEARAADAADQLRSAETLLARGIVTRARVIELRQQLAAAREAVTEAGTRAVRIGADEISARNQDARDVGSYRSRLAEADRRVQDLAGELTRRQWVVSPAAGRVIEVKTPRGARVEIGTPVVALETGSARLQAIVYLPPRDGKLVRPGMAVNISPSTARREEYGTMVGRVESVSEYPATQIAMMATLQNETLVSQFSASGAPIAARVTLSRDAGTATGYRWAGGRGPAAPLTSGTIVDATVTVRRDAPIGFAIPLLREKTGL